MDLFERPLVALDGGDESQAALEAVIRLRSPEPPGTRIHVAAVVERDARGILERGLARALDAGVAADSVLLDGHIVDELLRESEECAATCIALGTHGLSGVARAILGSVTEDVLRRSVIPVLVVRPGHVSSAVQRVLCAIDASPASHDAAQLALRMAHARGIAITFASVVAIDDTFAEGYERDGFDPDGVIGNLYEAAGAELAPFIECAAQLGTNATQRVTGASDTGAAIVALAADEHADMIVMGTHGRRGIERAIVGSTAEYVLRTAGVPVVALRDPRGVTQSARPAAAPRR